MHDRRRRRLRERGAQAARQLVDGRQLAGLRALPLLAPPAHLAFDVAVGVAEVAEPDRLVVDRVDRDEHVDELLGAAARVVGASAAISAGVRRICPVDLLHHVEGRVVDREVVAERERRAAPARRWARARRAPCTRAPCRARSAARGRAAGGAAPTRASPSRDRVREVRAAAGDERRGERRRRSRRRRARRTTVAAVRGRLPAGVSVTPGRLPGCSVCLRGAWIGQRLGDAGLARRDGLAVATRGSGRPGRRACRRGSPRRRALLRTRRPRSRTRGARAPSRGTRRSAGHARQTRAGLRLAHGPGLGPLAGGREEQPRLARGRRPRPSTSAGR